MKRSNTMPSTGWIDTEEYTIGFFLYYFLLWIWLIGPPCVEQWIDVALAVVLFLASIKYKHIIQTNVYGYWSALRNRTQRMILPPTHRPSPDVMWENDHLAPVWLKIYEWQLLIDSVDIWLWQGLSMIYWDAIETTMHGHNKHTQANTYSDTAIWRIKLCARFVKVTMVTCDSYH